MEIIKAETFWIHHLAVLPPALPSTKLQTPGGVRPRLAGMITQEGRTINP